MENGHPGASYVCANCEKEVSEKWDMCPYCGVEFLDAQDRKIIEYSPDVNAHRMGKPKAEEKNFSNTY
jgi:RNA polymerase subunit RPABC4/transcription elongation factor Spt4